MGHGDRLTVPVAIGELKKTEKATISLVVQNTFLFSNRNWVNFKEVLVIVTP